jgi:hypothetical protein
MSGQPPPRLTTANTPRYAIPVSASAAKAQYVARRVQVVAR